MLRQLIIILADKNKIADYSGQLVRNMDRKLRELTEQGLYILRYEMADLIGKEPEEYDDEVMVHSMEETLWITDASVIAAKIRGMGGYCIAFLHGLNRSQDFSMVGYAFEDFRQLDKEYFVKIHQRFRGESWHILSTRRCEIRESKVADVEDFYRVYADPSITRYMENLYESIDEEREYIQTYIDKVYAFCGFGMWTVIDRRSGQIIGRAGLSLREGYEEPEIGFVIAKEFQRQGYAYEVCNAILNYAKKELEFKQIRAIVHKENEISGKLCIKLGFKPVGETWLDGHVHMEYLKKM